MKYQSVLWYTHNPLLIKYQESYFQKLLWVFSSHYAESTILDKNRELQKRFLLHPDISSLIQEISLWESKQLLEREVEHLCGGKQEALTMNQWQTIPGTNIKLTLHDNNPQNMQVWHPDHDQEGMLWWWEKTEQEWLKVFWKAFILLKNIDQNFFDELNQIIKKIIPMKTSVDVHNSCSYKECIGTLYLGYTINSQQPELNILEALIHESSHNKLNLIMQSEKLHVNDYNLQYYSPYRPDARHIQGVLLGVHAIVPTVYIVLQAIAKWYITSNSWHEKILLYHIKNKLWYRVLSRNAKFTAIWRQIFNDMWGVIKMSDTLIKEITEMQQLDLSEIQQRAKKHFLQVKTNYPHVQY